MSSRARALSHSPVGCRSWFLPFRIGRHSRSLDTARFVCAFCGGQLALRQPPGRAGTPARTQLTPFAKYVKENYALAKREERGLSHAEVMKKLSADFAVKTKLEDSFWYLSIPPFLVLLKFCIESSKSSEQHLHIACLQWLQWVRDLLFHLGSWYAVDSMCVLKNCSLCIWLWLLEARKSRPTILSPLTPRQEKGHTWVGLQHGFRYSPM